MDLQNRTQEVRDILARSHSGALSHQERTENERRLYALLEEDIVSQIYISQSIFSSYSISFGLHFI